MTLSQVGILIAEDHDFQRQALARMVTSMGAKRVQEARDGKEALAIITGRPEDVDIVICDLDMPGMDGMECLRHLGETGATVSIILSTALESTLLASVGTMCKAYGVNLLGTLPKPLKPAGLVPLVEQHNRSKSVPEKPRAPGLSFTIDEVMDGIRKDEFDCFYQPKIEVATRRVVGAEALARWRHPTKGVVAPYAFIPLLEQHGMIDALTFPLLRKAAAFTNTWTTAPAHATVSVNLSSRSLVEVGLAERLTAEVKAQGVEPARVVLEITESAATTDVGRALENLARLRMKGFGLSIDDYGTGFSSMQQLTRIPFTELKIDRCFVTDAANQEAARVILESSLDMARRLNISTVAEGVETEADWKLLVLLGCHVAQGYFLARPMEGAALVEWTRVWRG